MATNDRPNVVVIMTDQQRADTSAREGFPLDTTPFLDGLASHGTWFHRAYTAAPICVPARISLLTGRFPSAHRVRDNGNLEHATYQHDLFDVGRARGYATAMIGKNHSHLTPGRVDHWFPLSHSAGFDPRHDAAFLSSAHPDFRPFLEAWARRLGEAGPDHRTDPEKAFDRWLTVLHHRTALEPTPFPLECQGPYRAVSDAQEWIRSLGGRPFLLWLTFAEPHNPYQVPEPYFSLFPPEALPPVRAGKNALEGKSLKWRWLRHVQERVYPILDAVMPRTRSNYFGMLRLIDDQIRRFVAFLETAGRRENTLLVFVSDHGDFVGEYGLIRKGPEMPEVLMRVPLFFVGPGVIAGREPHSAHVSIVDIFPTVCEAIGAPLPAGVQGRSLWPLLCGDDYPTAEFASVYGEEGFGGLDYTADDNPDLNRCLIPGPEGPTFNELNMYTQSGTMRMVRRDDWKLVFDTQGNGQLFNLARDPAELENLSGRPEHAEIQRRLLADLLTWTLRAQDPLPLPRGIGPYIAKSNLHNWRSP